MHMSALFHAFHLCQLWTVYCEMAESAAASAAAAATADFHPPAAEAVLDFWARLTPAILQLLSHSKVVRHPNFTFFYAVKLLSPSSFNGLARASFHRVQATIL